MLKVKVIGEVQTRTVNPKNGNPFQVREQMAVFFKPGQEYPDKGIIRLEDDNPGYKVGGEYMLHPESFYIDRFGGLALARHLKLQPVVAKKAA